MSFIREGRWFADVDRPIIHYAVKVELALARSVETACGIALPNNGRVRMLDVTDTPFRDLPPLTVCATCAGMSLGNLTLGNLTGQS